jgi:DNA-directed RNA polymerase specialized sigma24 family protein
MSVNQQQRSPNQASQEANGQTFRGESSFYTWLHTIALNEAKNGWRRKQTVSIESLTGPEPEALVECDVLADKLDRNECHLKLRKALRDIPAIYRRVLVD